jgi:hypothetical protein
MPLSDQHRRFEAYRYAGVEEITLFSARPRTEREMVARLEQIARDFVEPAAKL